MNYLKEMGAPVTYNNEVKLLMTGHDKFVDLFENCLLYTSDAADE